MDDKAKRHATTRNARKSAKEAEDRTGIFTTGVLSTKDGRQIALYFTGRQHAGENLGDVLRRRAADLRTPIQMCDALSRNVPEELGTILANCNAHNRRNYVDVVESFPEECRHVIDALAIVYKNEAVARAEQMSPEERLKFHQEMSGPIMAELEEWLKAQIEEKKVEPNSGLGEAISYSLKHWEKLTLFLREPGAPLDNNLVELSLKKAIMHRKNSLFFKTEHGAEVGDAFMSLIYTCELQGVDPFDYLTELQRHSAELAANPKDWMPWNYRETIARLAGR